MVLPLILRIAEEALAVRPAIQRKAKGKLAPVEFIEIVLGIEVGDMAARRGPFQRSGDARPVAKIGDVQLAEFEDLAIGVEDIFAALRCAADRVASEAERPGQGVLPAGHRDREPVIGGRQVFAEAE